MSVRVGAFVVSSLVSRGSNVRPGLVHMHTYRSVFAHPKTDLVPPMATFAATSEGPFDFLPAGTCSVVRRLSTARSHPILMTDHPQTAGGTGSRSVGGLVPAATGHSVLRVCMAVLMASLWSGGRVGESGLSFGHMSSP